MEAVGERYLVVCDDPRTPYLRSFLAGDLEWTSSRDHAARHGSDDAGQVVQQLSALKGLRNVRAERY